MEKYRSKERDLQIIFVDLKKDYDHIPRDVLSKALEKKGVCITYIRTIQDMHEGITKGITISVRTPKDKTKDFPIRIELYQGSTLSPYLFNLVLDELIKNIQKIILNCMLFVDDIVLIEKSREAVNNKLDL